MKPSYFGVSTDDNGKRFIYKVTSELTKNHKGLRNEQFEPEVCRMYKTRTPLCPVKSFIKYLDRRNLKCKVCGNVQVNHLLMTFGLKGNL